MIAAFLWALVQDPTVVAREHFRIAEAAEKRGDYDAALQEYVAAYEAKPHPAVLYNIATVYERLGDPEEAVHYYQRYLEGRPDAPDAAPVRARIGQIKMRPSKVTVETQPGGAHITVDGIPKCDAPCEMKVSAGDHEVAALFPGADPQRKKITAEYGKPIPLAFTLRRRTTGRLVVRSIPDGATIVVDGETIGNAPLELEVASGRHRVGARLRGYRTTTELLDVPDGESAEWAPELPPLGARAGQTPTGEVVEPPQQRLLPPSDENRLTMRALPSWTYGGVGGPNLLHAGNSWGGGFSFGMQSGGQSVDLETAIMFPVLTVEFDLRWYLVTSSFFRPFLVFGLALVAEPSGDSSSSASTTTPVFTTFNAGGGFALDFGAGAFYVEALANYVLTEAPERFSVPMLAGVYFRSGR